MPGEIVVAETTPKRIASGTENANDNQAGGKHEKPGLVDRTKARAKRAASTLKERLNIGNRTPKDQLSDVADGSAFSQRSIKEFFRGLRKNDDISNKIAAENPGGLAELPNADPTIRALDASFDATLSPATEVLDRSSDDPDNDQTKKRLPDKIREQKNRFLNKYRSQGRHAKHSATETSNPTATASETTKQPTKEANEKTNTIDTSTDQTVDNLQTDEQRNNKLSKAFTALKRFRHPIQELRKHAKEDDSPVEDTLDKKALKEQYKQIRSKNLDDVEDAMDTVYDQQTSILDRYIQDGKINDEQAENFRDQIDDAINKVYDRELHFRKFRKELSTIHKNIANEANKETARAENTHPINETKPDEAKASTVNEISEAKYQKRKNELMEQHREGIIDDDELVKQQGDAYRESQTSSTEAQPDEREAPSHESLLNGFGVDMDSEGAKKLLEAMKRNSDVANAISLLKNELNNSLESTDKNDENSGSKVRSRFLQILAALAATAGVALLGTMKAAGEAGNAATKPS